MRKLFSSILSAYKRLCTPSLDAQVPWCQQRTTYRGLKFLQRSTHANSEKIIKQLLGVHDTRS